MGKLYISTTISPAMLNADFRPVMEIHEVNFDVGKEIIKTAYYTTGVVGHENTAEELSELLNMKKEKLFGRESLSLKVGDRVVAFIPQFRAPKAREFTDLEIKSTSFRVFYAECK